MAQQQGLPLAQEQPAEPESYQGLALDWLGLPLARQQGLPLAQEQPAESESYQGLALDWLRRSQPPLRQQPPLLHS